MPRGRKQATESKGTTKKVTKRKARSKTPARSKSSKAKPKTKASNTKTTPKASKTATKSETKATWGVPVWLYVPNIIGYIRIGLVFASSKVNVMTS